MAHTSSVSSRPSTIAMSLFAPGMSLMHRAGLGGLAASLGKIERLVQEQQMDDDEIPGWPWSDSRPPWNISSQQVVLDFGEPDRAGEFLERLFRFSFQIRDELIYLPGQYDDVPPNFEVRAYLQQGITLTFLQHGRVRKLAKKEKIYSYQPEGEGGATVHVEFKPCSSYKHQDGWKDLVDSKGRLKNKPIEVVGPLYPGAMVRHNAFAAQTKIEEGPTHILPLYFALVGCLTLSINRGSGVLIVPDVTDLLEFSLYRPWMTPTTARQCRIAGASDAVLQAEIRLRSKREAAQFGLPGCYGAVFQPTPWATQQKSRVRTLYVPACEDRALDLYEIALAELPPRILSRDIEEATGRGKNRKVVKRTEWFWVDSVVRPLIADNLARGQPWYKGFVDLMTKIDPATKKPIRNKVSFERKGLNAMINKIPWEDKGESTVVRAVHEAIRRRYGQIADENKNNTAAMKNRMSSEYDRWRLAFAGAKTAEQFRKSLCDLLSRAGVNPVLQQEWKTLLPMLDDSRWELTRDLALLALASYSGKGATGIDEASDSAESATGIIT